MLNNFETRHKSYLSAVSDTLLNLSNKNLENKEWGLADQKEVCKIQMFGLLETFLLLLELKAMQMNTFQLKRDSNGCPIYVYPNDLPEAAYLEPCTIKAKKCSSCCETPAPKGGIINAFRCMGINIVPALERMQIYPLGVRPDGISYMIINDTVSSPCQQTNPFQVNKIRNTR